MPKQDSSTLNFLHHAQCALTETLLHMPYSSATPYRREFETGFSIDHRYGDVCVFQTFAAAEEIARRTGVYPKFIRDDRHIGAVYDLEGFYVIIDPYLSHLTPVIVSTHEVAPQKTVAVPAAPTAYTPSAKPGVFSANYDESLGSIEIEQHVWSVSKREYFTYRKFCLDLSSEVSKDLSGINVKALLFHPEQKSVSIRVVDPVDMQYIEARLSLPAGYEPAVSDDIVVSDSSGPGFSRSGSATNRLCELTGLSWRDIEDHLRLAKDLYVENCPQWGEEYWGRGK
jgi:hypothetical protein